MALKYTNLEFLHENTQGNPELMAELIEIFLQTTPPMLEELKTLFKQQEWIALRKVAHKLKSNLFTLGIDELTEAVMKVEQYSGDPEQVDEIGKLIEKIRDITQIAFKELTQELEIIKK